MAGQLPGRLRLTVVCLHISAGLYVLVALGAVLVPLLLIPSLPPEEAAAAGIFVIFGLFFALICIGLAIGVELVTWHLTKLRYWAWITAIVICAFYLTSLFLPLGALGLWGLLDAGTQAAFQSARLRGRT